MTDPGSRVGLCVALCLIVTVACGSGGGVEVASRLGSVTERSVVADASSSAAVAGVNEFAVDVYREVAAGESGNVVLGPYSVAFALSMAYAGAGGDTATEMGAVLHAGGVDGWHEQLNAYDVTLAERTEGTATSWNTANRVWGQPGVAWNGEFLDVLTGVYGVPLAEADFINDAEQQRQNINAWVDEQTDEMIPELIGEGVLDELTRMVLVNAIALDALWEYPFDPPSNQLRPFTRADGTTVDTVTMDTEAPFVSAITAEYQAVELPYQGGALSMIVVMPADLAAFEAGLSRESLTAVFDSLTPGEIKLTLPLWTARTQAPLNDTLKALGMPTAFTLAADFTPMVTDTTDLHISDVVHEAFIEVDALGTRAAAATAVIEDEISESLSPRVEINRPFLYVIRDRQAGTILFIGRITDPTITP